MGAFSSFDKLESSCNKEIAVFLADTKILESFTTSAILKFNTPLCWVPIKFPGPRNFKSTSAILNPSVVSTIVFKRVLASADNLKLDNSIQ